MWKFLALQSALALVLTGTCLAQTSISSHRRPSEVHLSTDHSYPLLKPSLVGNKAKVNGTLSPGILYAVGASSATGESTIFSIDNYSSNPVANQLATFNRYLVDAAIDPTTQGLYVLDSDFELYRVDLVALSATPIGRSPAGENSIVFDNAGQAYEWGFDRFLYKIDKNTGQASVVGDTGFSGAGDLAFDLDGALFGTTDNGYLIRIDPSTGSSSAIGPTGFNDYYGLAIDSSGTLYAGRGSDFTSTSEIYRINKATGASTLVGSVANDSYPITGFALFVSPQSGQVPNLVPYRPDGWSDKVVVSKATGTQSDSATISTTDKLYVSWAVLNDGTASTAAKFNAHLYLDGAFLQGWYTDIGLQPSVYAYVKDFPIGLLGAGNHSLQIVADATGAITESDETDNQYVKNFSVTVAGPASSDLNFPLKGYSPGRDRHLSAYSAKIISVFDHSMVDSSQPSNPFYPYHCDHAVVAFTGERGDKKAGHGDSKCIDHPNYSQSSQNNFTITGAGLYTGSAPDGPQYLNYDGHPGYDYVAASGTQVFAAVSGTIHYPKNHVQLSDAYNTFHVLEIIPDGGLEYRFFYLHLSTHPSKSGIHGTFSDPSPAPGCPATVDLPLPEGQHVNSGCLVALSGSAGTPGAHLHFEVQKVISVGSSVRYASALFRCLDQPGLNNSSHACLPVDPYGWSGAYPDPYQTLTGVTNTVLWAP